MKFCSLLFLCWIAQNASVLGTEIIDTKQMRYGQLYILTKDLQSLNWGNDEDLCLNQLLNIIKNVQNSTLWATWIWDSMQSPVGQLYGSRNNFGNYDECLDFPWEKVHPDMRTQYCMAHVHLADVDSDIDPVDLFGDVKKYIRGKTKLNLEFNTLKWGVCTPAVCKPHSVIKFVGALFRQTHLGLAVDKPQISINYCNVAGDIEDNRDFGYYLSGSLIVSTILLTLLGTLFINYKGMNSKSAGLWYVQAFHIPKNIESLVTITDKDLQSLFGIRVFTCILVIFIHVWTVPKFLGVFNAVRLDKDMQEPWALSATGLEVIVDTFMFMSGLLLIKTLATGLKTFNPVNFIVKRYLRLILPIFLVSLTSFKFISIPQGPAKKDYYDTELEACKKTWWAIPLMIHNYVDLENMCYPIVWSVAGDFHLAVFGTIGNWLFERKRKLGLLMFLVGFTASIVFPATAAISHPELALIRTDFKSFNNHRKYAMVNPLYAVTHFRAGSYFVGMAAGYLITQYNPVTHRNVISKKCSILSFGALLAMFAGYFIIAYYVLILDINVFVLALYVSLKRIFWAVLITILVIISEYGTLPLIPGFLSWSAWAPFSRLSYGIFLVHIPIVSYWRIATRQIPEYDYYHFTLTTLGVTVASCFVSLLLWTFYEEPLRVLISHALRDRNKKNAEQLKNE